MQTAAGRATLRRTCPGTQRPRGSCAAGAMGDGRDGIYGCGMKMSGERRLDSGFIWSAGTLQISPGGLSTACARDLGPRAFFVCAHAHLSIKRQTLSFFACGKNKTLWGKLDESPILNGIFDSYKNFLSIFYVNRLTFLKADGILVSIRKGRKFESKGRPKHA